MPHRKHLLRLAAATCLSLLCLVLACEKKPGQDAPDNSTSTKADALEPVEIKPTEVLPAARVEAGKQHILEFECNRCHVIDGVADVPTEKSCVTCHQQILAGTFEAKPEVLQKWQKNIIHLTATPELSAMAPRFKRSWLVDFLQNPHDLRPRVDAQMPRMKISEEDANKLADYLLPEVYAAQQMLPGDAKRGEERINALGCGSCHAMSGGNLQASAIPVKLKPEELALGMKLAPDLRHTRRRFHPATLVTWLRDPASIKPSTKMPKIPMSEQDARDIAAFLITSNLSSLPEVKPPERLPVLERRVRYGEVSEKVFKKVCWHCHSEADYVGGDGGPGNTGGFGFEGRGLSLAEYTAIASGMRDDQGKRTSVFKDAPNGMPWLVAVMYARHVEVAGGKVEGVRGMPLGLPPMTLEEIQLVETWISQGRPR
ncbi:MAG: cytochrome C oxidase Cbb3 [Myxococcota bacterium]|nr:cytochrome C oxidase Cbb3 [Myxococcota bacterium]